MTLHGCRSNRGIQKKYNLFYYAQSKAVYADDLSGRIRAGLLFILFTALNWLACFFCLLQRLLILFPQWRRSLIHFCPDKKAFVPGRPLVIGHRGNPLKAIENTVPACQLALNKFGAQAVEVDLCVTRDNQIVLWHDWDANDIEAVIRQMGLEPKVKYRPYVSPDRNRPARVSQLTLDEFRKYYNYSRKRGRYKSCNAHIPLLGEFFEWATRQSRLKMVFLDIKVPPREKDKALILVSELRRLVKKYRPSFDIILLTPHESVLLIMRQSAGQFDYSLDVIPPLFIVPDPQDFSATAPARRLKNRFASVGRPTALDIAPWATYRQIIAYDRRQMQAGLSFPKRLIAWTINNRREMNCLIRMGVDGILTDRPWVLAKIVRGSTIHNLIIRLTSRS